MKVCVIQPYYSFDENEANKCFEDMMKLLNKCDESMDLIVLPEYCDIPAAMKGKAFHESIEKRNEIVYKRVSETARRCNALVFANFGCNTESGPRNTTYVFDREGNVTGKYFKAHPAPSEVNKISEGGNEMDCSYSYEYRPPYTIEIEGIRFGFMTCYDFYMYESYASLARMNVDVIIGCSHQRTDTHNALDIFGRFLSYNTNSYLIRSAVSLGENSDICGCSMVVSPKGEMLLNMKSKIGLAVCDINPHDKYYKPAGFKGKEKPHYEYIDDGRRPWLYRPGGSMMVPCDKYMKYPRVCAYGGLCSDAPKSSMPAFGAAVAVGANEIAFDLYTTADGELVTSGASRLELVSNGAGNIEDFTLDELKKLDFGAKSGVGYRGLGIVTFEEILKKFSCTAIMNINIKAVWSKSICEKAVSLIYRYDCVRYVYVTSESDTFLQYFHKVSPEIRRCLSWNGSEEPINTLDRAAQLGCERIMLPAYSCTDEIINSAHSKGIKCNALYLQKSKRDINTVADTAVLTNFSVADIQVKQISR